MERKPKTYYFTCMDNIAQQLLAGKFAMNGLVDVYMDERDALKNRHPGDNCVVELKVPEEVLSNSKIYGLYAMIAGTELCKYLFAIYPLQFRLQIYLDALKEQRMRSRSNRERSE